MQNHFPVLIFHVTEHYRKKAAQNSQIFSVRKGRAVGNQLGLPVNQKCL